jgi:hypothetical protein
MDNILGPVRDPLKQKMLDRSADLSRQYESWVTTTESWLAAHPISDDDDQLARGERKYREDDLVRRRDYLGERQRFLETDMKMFEAAWSFRLGSEDKYGTENLNQYGSQSLAQLIDPRTVRDISVVVPSGYTDGALDYRMSLEADSNGVKLTVETPSRAETEGAVGRLTGELKRARPWWAFMQHRTAVFIAAWIIFTAAWYPVVATANVFEINSLAPLFSIFCGMGSAYWLSYGIRRALPPVLILDDHGKSRSGAAVAFIAALVLSFPIGLLVNYVS